MPENNDGQKPAPKKLSLVERAAQELAAVTQKATSVTTSVRPAAPPTPPPMPAPAPKAPEPARHAVAEPTAPSPASPSTDPHLRELDEVVSNTHTVFLDIDALAAKGMVTPRGERGRMAEEYRLIKRPLLQYARAGLNKPDPKSNLLMVTSALPGEGKTFTSVNLAMSMAKERDTKVLLIDADLSRPSLATRLGMTEKTLGLTDLLDDARLDIGEVLLRTNIPNLSIIPAGRPHRMGTELLASRRAETLIGELAGRYPDRIILFDTSPVLATSEGSALGLQVGQVILVVEAEKTTELDIRGALDVLSGCSNIMILLNKTRTRFAFHRYGYYYGDYYGGRD